MSRSWDLGSDLSENLSVSLSGFFSPGQDPHYVYNADQYDTLLQDNGVSANDIGTVTPVIWAALGYANADAFWNDMYTNGILKSAIIAEIPSGNPADLLTSPFNAWSFSKQLVSAYSGDLILVRRSSDDTTQAIGINNGVIDTAALESFCSGTDGYVVTVYDQIGSIDLTNATNSQQPQIVSGGTALVDSGGNVAALFDGSSAYLASGTEVSIAAYPLTMIGIMDADGAITGNLAAGAWLGGIGASNRWHSIGVDTGDTAYMDVRNTTLYRSSGSTDIVTTPERKVITGVYRSATDRELYLNSSSEATGVDSQAIVAFKYPAIGRFNDTSPDSYWKGYVSDVIISEADETSNIADFVSAAL